MTTNTKLSTTIILWMLITAIALLSCSTSPSKDTQPSVDIDERYLNNQVTVRAPEIFNSFRTNDPVILEILNYSDNEIRFSNDYSLRIFKKTDDGWVEIKEIPTTRLPEDDIIFSPNSSTIEDFAVFPDLKDYSQNYRLRIYIIGDMQTEQGHQKVSAYTEVQLQP